MVKDMVSYVILSWNGRDDTLKCIESLQKSTYKPAEIVVVDNGSVDGTTEAIKSKYPEVIVVENATNLGVSGGSNSALPYAQGEYIALLNNDIVVDPKWAEEIMKVLKPNTKAAACCGRIYHWDEGKNPEYGTDNEEYSLPYMNEITGEPNIYLPKRGLLPNYVPGGAAIFRRSVIDEIGLFEDVYFTYFEDADWSAKALRAGYEFLDAPKAKLWHYGNKATGTVSKRTLFYNRRNQLVFIILNFDKHHLWSALWHHFKKTPEHLLKLLLWPINPELRRRHTAAYFKGSFAFLLLLPQLLKIRRDRLVQFPGVSFNAKIKDIHTKEKQLDVQR